MTRKPEIEILCGPVASGKSTYSRQRAEEGYVIVNNDAIVTAVHGGNYRLYDEFLKPVYKSIHSAMIHTAVTAGRNVVIDDCHLTRSTRTRLAELAKCLGCSYYFIVFPWEAPPVHAVRRIEQDPRGYSYDEWLQIIKGHRERWEPLTDEEQKFARNPDESL